MLEIYRLVFVYGSASMSWLLALCLNEVAFDLSYLLIIRL